MLHVAQSVCLLSHTLLLCLRLFHALQEAAAAKAKAEERAALLFAKKKNTAVERKQKKEQKDEAEKHIAAQEALVRDSDSSSGGMGCMCLSNPCGRLFA